MRKLPFLCPCTRIGIVASLLFFQTITSTHDKVQTMNLYREEEVQYENKTAGVTLAGTLTIPQTISNTPKPAPAVILIAGYGPNDRDLTMRGQRHFFVLADYLTKRGIAVLRFDKRGAGQSTGVYETATSRDFADDVIAGLAYLQTRTDLDHKNIGLIGHSEGGMIATMIASEQSDIAFAVSMAGAILSDIDNLVEQTGMQMKADGATADLIKHDKAIHKQIFTIVRQEPDAEKAKLAVQNAIISYWKELPDALKTEAGTIHFAISDAKAEVFSTVYTSPWYRYFFSIRGEEMLQKVTMPYLALYGDHDFIASSKLTLPVIERALQKAGNTQTTLIELPNLNHTFQTCSSGAMAEYATINESFAPIALKTMGDWIINIINQK